MTLHLPDYKVEAIKADCNNLIACDEVSVRELSQLIGRLTASIQAIFSAPLHYRHLQHLKHQALAQRKEGLGRGVPKSKNRGAVLSDGAEASHKLFGASSGLLSREASHGQHFDCSLCEPSRGDSLPCPSQFGPGSVGMGPEPEYFPGCRTPFQPPECHSRLAISTLRRFEQLAAMPTGVSGSDADSQAICLRTD